MPESSAIDSRLYVDRVKQYFDLINSRFHTYLAVFFPEVNHEKQPLFTERLSEREEFILLRETAMNLRKVRQGEMEPSLETNLFAANEGGAQERLMELTQKFREDTD